MRPIACLVLVSLALLSSCATNPLRIPPRPHALPSRARPADPAAAPESRPAVLPTGFDPAADDGSWRTGDSVTFGLDFEDCGVIESYWLVLEVARYPTGLADPPRALVRTTLFDKDGVQIGTARRRIDPQRITDCSQELIADYTTVVSSALAGEDPEKIQERIDEELGEGSVFEDARSGLLREIKKTLGPRFVREKLKDPAIKSSIGSISLLDVALAALTPIEVLVDVNQIKAEQEAVANFEDIPVAKPIRVPFVMTIGGNIQFRFAVTVTTPAPPYALTAGILEIAGVNECCGERRFLVRLVSARRGPPPETDAESRESRPSPE